MKRWKVKRLDKGEERGKKSAQKREETRRRRMKIKEKQKRN